VDQYQLLIETLRDAQRLGFFGAAPIEGAVAHAEEFLTAIGPLASGARVVDIGSGGGLPGLVVAAALPHASVTLVDRREKRTDFLQRAVRRLGYRHVMVVTTDVDHWSRGIAEGGGSQFEVVTARGFGPPDLTLSYARRLIGGGGRIVISEPPSGNRWSPGLLDRLGLTSERSGAVRVFTVVQAADQG
jgi:16S rRNA (guanine527-N7)-methyltransferase